jgi:hypothetical protein
MLHRITRPLLTVMLSAILLAGSMMPQGIRHKHSGGSDLSHKHRNLSSTSPSHSHHDETLHGDDHSQSCRSQSPTTVGGSLWECATHLHFEWFGLQWAFPDSGKAADENRDTNESQLVSLCSSEYLGITPQQNIRIEKFSLLVYPCSPLQVSGEIQVVNFFSQPVTINLLCDRARHERSGVLLA